MKPNQNKHGIGIYICYFILFIIVFLVFLTVFNMDLFSSYFKDISTSSSFGAFISRFFDYIIALLKHTFS